MIPVREIEPGVFVVHIRPHRGPQSPAIERALEDLRRAVRGLRQR